MQGGRQALAQRRNSENRDKEMQDLKKIIGDQSLVIEVLKKASCGVMMMVFEDLKDKISVREISMIYGIPFPSFYYMPVRKHIQSLDPSATEEIKHIAPERPTNGYRRVLPIPMNQSIG